MLEKFKTRKLLANQDIIERKVDILRKLANKSEGVAEELDELSYKHDLFSISRAVECYYCHGDYRGGLEAVLKFGNSPAITLFGWLLRDLQIFYERLTDRSFLCMEKVKDEFEEIKER